MNLRALVGYAWPYRASLAICALLMLVDTVASLLLPWLGGRFAADVLAGASAGSRPILAALLALFALQAVLKFTNGYILGRTAERILADLRIRIYDHLQALPLSFYQERRLGDVLALLTYEVAQLSTFMTGTLLSVVPLTLTVVGATVMMFRFDPLLAGLVAALLPPSFVLMKVVGRRLRPLSRELQQAHAAAVATAEENLSILPAIKTFTREPLESKRYARQIHRVLNLSVREHRIAGALDPLLQFASATAVVFLLWLASSRVGAGTMTPSEMVSFLLYAALLTRPMSALAGFYGQAQMARGTLERLQSVLTEPPECAGRGNRVLETSGGAIEFRRVSFAYPGRPPALLDVSLSIGAGEIVAITGENGAGKSTLAHLLLRLHELDVGRILIDGTDIATVDLRSLRRHIGIVPQHVLLLNASVRDNICFADPDADWGRVEAAARAAQAHAFITGLPQGYDTMIGDHGIRLSGGQRQRVALARALLKDPPILVLDEATAMFDPEGERSFVEDCRPMLTGRTVILITHRPASLALADRVVKLESGAIDPVRALQREAQVPHE